MAVLLCDSADIYPELLHGVRILQEDEWCWYLGVLVGDGRTGKAKWGACFVALNWPFAKVRRKTNTVRSRSTLAAAVFIPQITSMTTCQIISMLQNPVKRFVRGSQDVSLARGWMSAEQAELWVCDGGLSLSHVAAGVCS